MNTRQTTNWIRKADKYHRFWQCSICGGKVICHGPELAPPEHCPFCGSKMTVENNGDDEQ